MKSKRIFSIFILLTLLVMCCGVAFASDSIDDTGATHIDKISVKDFSLDDSLSDDSNLQSGLDDDSDLDDDLDDDDDWDDDSDLDDDLDDDDDWDDDSDWEDDWDDDWDDDDSDWEDDWDDDWDDDSDWYDYDYTMIDKGYVTGMYKYKVKYLAANTCYKGAGMDYRRNSYSNSSDENVTENETEEDGFCENATKEDEFYESSTWVCYGCAHCSGPTVYAVGINYSMELDYDVSSPQSNVNDYSVSKSIDYQEDLNQATEDKNTTKLDAGKVNNETVVDVDENNILLLFVTLLLGIILII